ncbi:MerR family transcriptional regulator [Actinomadura sp. 3N508]|uniref:MerR family transcriptional regulator n=1 Tax=Actinomadura sp. 3N508 TaxID=3375153 RepID=UPI00378F603B
MSIGELAARFGVAPHVLRHWESADLLQPAARVNGRRRYQQEHVARVAMIVRGKEAGFSLRQLAEMFATPEPQHRRELLQEHHARLVKRIALTEAAKELIEHVLNCPAEDFIQCPEFQRLVEAVERRVPFPPT